jgi:large subunit ribosomal protein L23
MTVIYNVLEHPLVTEKSRYQSIKLNQYVFVVAGDATKVLVKDAIEKLFDVSVVSVNIINAPAKRSRRARSRRLLVRRGGYKKAIVTLAEGQSLPIFEGVQ